MVREKLLYTLIAAALTKAAAPQSGLNWWAGGKEPSPAGGYQNRPLGPTPDSGGSPTGVKAPGMASPYAARGSLSGGVNASFAPKMPSAAPATPAAPKPMPQKMMTPPATSVAD